MVKVGIKTFLNSFPGSASGSLLLFTVYLYMNCFFSVMGNENQNTENAFFNATWLVRNLIILISG